jgi:PadR family transcriptional regulator, regulatory protein PadR
MSEKQLRVDFIELHILHHAAEEPLYGLWMIEELARHGYRVGPSHLYPRFHRLGKQGLLLCSRRVVGGRLRKYYRITAQGRRYMQRQRKRLMQLAGEALGPEEIREVLALRLAREESKKRG